MPFLKLPDDFPGLRFWVKCLRFLMNKLNEKNYENKPQTPNPKPQTPNPKPQTSNLKPQTPNPKPQTPNPKPQTSNPKPQTLDTDLVS
jgi:hypothetical protein